MNTRGTYLDKSLFGFYRPDGLIFHVTVPFRYVTRVDPAWFGYTPELPRVDGGWLVEIPSGAVTDFISSPPWMWSIVPPIGRAALAGAIHDTLYDRHPEGRPWCDEVLYEALRTAGVSRWRAFAYWLTARVFGRPHWG